MEGIILNSYFNIMFATTTSTLRLSHGRSPVGEWHFGYGQLMIWLFDFHCAGLLDLPSMDLSCEEGVQFDYGACLPCPE